MLPTRSVFVQASVLLVLITAARSQHYESDYKVTEGDEDDRSEYSEDGRERPDYSKYYSVDDSGRKSSFQIGGNKDDGAFVSPIDFSQFLQSPQLAFGALNNPAPLQALVVSQDKKDAGAGFVTAQDFKADFSEYDADGFGARDYFEQAQKQDKQQQGNEEEADSKPGPNYASRKSPVKIGYEHEIDSFRQKPKTKAQETPREEGANPEEEKEISEYNNFNPAPLDLSQFELPKSGPTSVRPNDPNYHAKYTHAPINPYQKFNFQALQPATTTNFGIKQAAADPHNYHKSPAKVVNNYEYLPSEIVPQNLKGGDCERTFKVDNKKPLECYACRDSKSGAKSEYCSYSTEPKPSEYYQSNAQSYGKKNPDLYRNKREDKETYASPYEEIKAQSHKYFSKPEEFEKDLYKAPDFKFNLDYAYDPQTFNDKETEEKSYSEIQSEALAKQGDKCKKSHKNGITCTVCEDPKTGANYEQCSYESEPNEKQYAYVRESKYDGDGNPVEDADDADNSKTAKTQQRDKNEAAEEEEDGGDATKEGTEYVDDEPKRAKLQNYKFPDHFVESTLQRQKAGVRGLDPELYGNADAPEKVERNLPLFPHHQFGAKEEATAETGNPYFEDLTGKREVEKVLEEFTKKDRSNCKQVKKKGMTCYLCVNDKGIKQEECMYVSESRPQSSHVAYHEMQHVKKPDESRASESESRIDPVEAAANEAQKRKRFFKKAAGAADDSVANASDNVESRVKFGSSEPIATDIYSRFPKNKRYVKNKPKAKKAEALDPQPQFDVKDEEGLYSAETKPVYSKVLGVTLPKYMLEKTPFELDFDRTVAAG